MSIFNFYFLVMTLLGYGNVNEKDIVVIGHTANAKQGAIVISEKDKKGYYLEGMHYWEERLIGKKVKVTGKLLVEKFDPPKPGEPEKQQMVGEKRTILKPKWELVR